MTLVDFTASLENDGDAVGEKAFDGIGTPEAKPELKNEEGAKDTLPAPPAEQTTTTGKPPQGGDSTPDEQLPFHKHPRWIQRDKELNDLREKAAQWELERKTYQDALGRVGSTTGPKKELPPMPDWFTAVYGKDEQMWEKQLEFFDGIKAQAKQEFLTESEKKQQQAQAENEKWQKWVKDSLQGLRDEGLEFDDNELQKVAADYLPSDANGNIDFHKAYNILQAVKKAEVVPQTAQINAKKQIADATMGKPKADVTKPKFESPASLRNKSWDNLISE